jgi:hypothetical protein
MIAFSFSESADIEQTGLPVLVFAIELFNREAVNPGLPGPAA